MAAYLCLALALEPQLLVSVVLPLQSLQLTDGVALLGRAGLVVENEEQSLEAQVAEKRGPWA